MKKTVEKELVPQSEPVEVSPEQEIGQSVASTIDLSPNQTEKMVEMAEKNIQIIGQFIKRQLKDGVDYGTIAFHAKTCPLRGTPKLGPNCQAPFCKMSKSFLHKPGSEKFAILFNHRAKFFWLKQDFDKGIFAVKCVFINRKDDKAMGEGYGSARVSEKEKWTENEAMKIACKRAQIDAALRTYGLSEHFTQDLDDIATRKPQLPPNSSVGATFAPRQISYQDTPRNIPMTILDPNAPVTQPQLNKIFLMITKLGKDKDWFEKWVTEQTGIEGVENLSKGLASKFIDLMQKKYEGMNQEGLEEIDISEPKESAKRDEEIVPESKVEEPDEWSDF